MLGLQQNPSQQINPTMGAISGGLAGAQAGMAFGPWGAAAGAAIGIGASLLQSSKLRRDLKRQQNRERLANDYNAAQQAYNQGVDVDQITLAEDGLEMMYPSKLIEVEGDELLFQKTGTLNGQPKFKLKADFKKGRKHEEGGIPYMAEQGDIIIPAKLRDKALKAYESGDNLQLEAMRMKLPIDTPTGARMAKGTRKIQMYPNGTGNVETGPFNGLGDAIMGATRGIRDAVMTPVNYVRNELALRELDNAVSRLESNTANRVAETDRLTNQMNYLASSWDQNQLLRRAAIQNADQQIDELNYGIQEKNNDIAGNKAAIKLLQQSTSGAELEKFRQRASGFKSTSSNQNKPMATSQYKKGTRKIQMPQYAAGAAAISPEMASQGIGTIANLLGPLMGMNARAEQVNPILMDKPKGIQYNDLSQPLRNQAQANINANQELARQLSGGNIGNILASGRVNRAQGLTQLQQINSQEAARRDQINAMNTQAENQAAQYNTQATERAYLAQQQNDAAAAQQRSMAQQQLITNVGNTARGFQTQSENSRQIAMQQKNQDQYMDWLNRAFPSAFARPTAGPQEMSPLNPFSLLPPGISRNQ